MARSWVRVVRGLDVAFRNFVANERASSEEHARGRIRHNYNKNNNNIKGRLYCTLIRTSRLAVCVARLNPSWTCARRVPIRVSQVKNKRYGATEDTEGEKFPSNLFLVFANRLLAMLVSAAMVTLPLRSEPPGGWAKQASGGAELDGTPFTPACWLIPCLDTPPRGGLLA